MENIQAKTPSVRKGNTRRSVLEFLLGSELVNDAAGVMVKWSRRAESNR
jgi:hypothetical protein